MKLGIMQPYFVPYIGYWQLMNAVDTYVVYDDVNYIKRGWVNRNRILVGNQPMYFTIPLSNASQWRRINEIEICDASNLFQKNLRSFELAYKKAPYFHEVYPLVAEITLCNEKKLIDFLMNSIVRIRDYLGITSTIMLSSSIQKNNSLTGQDKIIEICKKLKASEYVNATGGVNLYSPAAFSAENIELRFLKTDDISYRQFGPNFCPNLSILDVMAFNSKDEIKKMLTQYTLMKGMCDNE